MRNCKWCNNPIQPNHHVVVGTECDRCWELRSRMEDDVELASKILTQLTKCIPDELERRGAAERKDNMIDLKNAI